MSKKFEYKINNWSGYNKSLIKRGDITLWLDEITLESCRGNVQDDYSGRGRPRTYPNIILKAMLCLRYYYRLPLRATVGFFGSIVKLSGIPNPSVPDYTTLCRRQKGIDLNIAPTRKDEPIHILLDSTGSKVFGEGEWKVRKHGNEGRRTWRKLHLAVDEKSQMIYARELTENDVHDSNVVEDLLYSIKAKITKVSADGAYDTMECRYVINEVEAVPVVPPRSNAVINTTEDQDEVIEFRNEAIKSVNTHGIDNWKKESGYHRRSIV